MKELIKGRPGVTAVEYAVMMAIAVVVIIAVVSIFFQDGRPPQSNGTPISAVMIGVKTITVEMPDGSTKKYVTGKAKDGEISMKGFSVSDTRVVVSFANSPPAVYILQRKEGE